MTKSLIKKISGRVRRICERLNFYKLANDKVRKSNWYYNQFPHLREFDRLERGADILCIGSTPAKNAIDFVGINNVKGFNLAICPETIFYDFQVLKNYHSYLREGGTILFVLCPFTFLKDYYRNEYGSNFYLNIRYYPVLHRAMIDTFDYKLYHKWVEAPMLIGKEAWKRLIKDRPQSKQMGYRSNPSTPEESKIICKERLKNWMREFHMKNLNPSDIPSETIDAINGNIEIFKKMKSFIEERGYKALIIVPPFPEEMVSLLPNELVNVTLMNPIKATGLPYLSYYGRDKWLSHDLYYHGFLLNARGRELLTRDILAQIEL